MAVETTDYEAAIRFLEAMAGECRGAGTGPAAAEAAPLDCGLTEQHAAYRATGEWAREYRVFTSGWMALEGVMVVAPEAEWDAGLRAGIVATNERALRDLLLSLPPGQTGLFLYAGEWMRHTLAEIVDGRPIPIGEAPLPAPSRQAGSCVGAYFGIKRGSGRLPPVDPGELARGRRGEPTRTAPCPAVETVASGKKDPALLEFRDLGSLKGRLGQSRFVAEGQLLVDRAVRDGLPVAQVLFTPAFAARPDGADLLRRAMDGCIPCCRVSEGLMGAVTTTRPVPPVIAAVFTEMRDASRCHLTPASAILVVDTVANPNNLGLVLRTADAAGVEAVVLIGKGASPFHKECVRASRGAVGRLPLFSCANAAAFLRGLAARGFRIVGATAHASHDLYATDIGRPVAFVVGNETEGIRADILELCTDRVRIPMAPGQSSLNVGVAAGVLLYEHIRRR